MLVNTNMLSPPVQTKLVQVEIMVKGLSNGYNESDNENFDKSRNIMFNLARIQPLFLVLDH